MPRKKQGALVRREDLFPSPWEQAHQELEGFSRKQPDWGVTELLWERQRQPLQRTQVGSLFFSNSTGWTKIKQTTSRESACWLQSCHESSTETSLITIQNPTHTHLHTPTAAPKTLCSEHLIVHLPYQGASHQSPRPELWKGRGVGPLLGLTSQL